MEMARLRGACGCVLLWQTALWVSVEVLKKCFGLSSRLSDGNRWYSSFLNSGTNQFF